MKSAERKECRDESRYANRYMDVCAVIVNQKGDRNKLECVSTGNTSRYIFHGFEALISLPNLLQNLLTAQTLFKVSCL